MNIPNPADLKKQADARRKAREAELASDLESLSKTKQMPDTTDSYRGRHLKKSSTPRSTSSQPKKSASSDSPTEQRSSSTTPKKNSTTVNSLLTGKGKNSPASAKESVEQVLTGTSKKTFERPDHLTQRPLRDHPGLKAMLESRPNDTRVRRETEKVTRQMQSNKAQRANKENTN